MLDPSKNKLDYFKDNIQTAEDQEEFDASQYYYNRSEGPSPGQSRVGSLGGTAFTGPNSSYPGMKMGAQQPFGTDVNNPLGAHGTSIRMEEMNAFSAGSYESNMPQNLMNRYSASNMRPDEISAGSTASIGVPGGISSGIGGTMYQPAPRSMYSGPGSDAGNAEYSASIQQSGHNSSQRLDMTNFPALESRISGMTISGEHDRSALRRAPFGQKLAEQEDFVIQKEDFPALSSAASTSDKAGLADINDLSTTTANTGLTVPSMIGTNASNVPSGASNGSSGEEKGKPSASLANEQLQYGLQGLLQVIRMTNKDLNTLSIGTDLTALGLNLNSSECLYSTFASPWADGPSASKEPQFNLPLCYYMQPPALKTSHLSKFQLETLFYIFYAMPKDILQAYSAQELYSREWCYHGDLKLWFKRATQADGISTTAGNSGTSGAGAGNPNGSSANGTQYIYFDINAWERRLFGGTIQGGIESGLLNEEEVRVKFANSSQ